MQQVMKREEWLARISIDPNICLEEVDVLACIAYGPEMARERCMDISLKAAP